MHFYKIHKEEGGIHFPISFPLEIPEIKVLWGGLDKDMSGNFRNQEENYKKYIEDKEILKIFDKAIKYLNIETKRVKKELS
ncbi:hypothetical protein [Clostridium sporogenes]